MSTHRNPGASLQRLAGSAALIAVTIALGGCLTHARDPNGAMAEMPSDYRLRHPIVIDEAPKSTQIFVGNGRGGLSALQRSEVISTGQAWLREGTGPLHADVPKNTPNARAAADSWREIHALLVSVGVPAHAILRRDYTPPDARQFATIRLSYPRIAAQAGPCGLWPDDVGPSIKNRTYIENKPYFNLGCASQRNLAAMVENPSDLVQPQPETPPYTARRNTVFDKYKKGNDPSIQWNAGDKGKLSDLAK